MAFTSAQSTIFSKQLSAYIQKNLVFKNAVDFTWQNDAQRNKVVTINALTAPTVYTYVAGQNPISGSDVAYTSQNLTLDQYKYFNIGVDDVLRATSGIVEFDPIAKAGGYELAQVQDAAIAALWSDTTSTKWICSGSSFLVNNAFTETSSSGSAYALVCNIAVKLDEAHCPKDGNRFIIAPSWFINTLAKDSNFAAFSPEVRAQGVFGTVAGMTVLQSENIVNANSIYNIIGCHKSWAAFATGLESLESLRSEVSFTTRIRALAVYGLKVINPTYATVAFAKAG